MIRSLRGRGDDRGVATVEAVLVVPFVLLPVLLGLMVLGRITHARLVIDAAAAAGARQAAVVGGDREIVRSRIAAELRDGGIDPARAGVSVIPAAADWGEAIVVRVSVAEQAGIPFLGSWAVPLEAEFTTRSEVTR